VTNPKKGSVALASADRRARLNALRNQKMARSPHAFVRGSTARFYEWLIDDEGPTICQGPPIWICGDCHTGNLGPIADADGHVSIQIRDLDQTVIGNPSLDLIRLGLSLATIARGSSLPGILTARMLEALLRGYLKGLLDHDPVKTDIAPSIHIVFKEALRRRWRDLAAERIDARKGRIPLGTHFWPLGPTQRTQLNHLVQSDAVRDLITALTRRETREAIALRDAAFWVKGCSSLGLLRNALLIDVGATGACLLDVKAASVPVAPAVDGAAMPLDQGERVVRGARALSPSLGNRMTATKLGKQSVFVRELLPQDLKIDIKALSESEAGVVAFLLASVVGHSHGRQLTRTDARAWAAELRRSHPKTLAAPSWLWTSIVRSIARHETEYLGHCRRFAALYGSG
jgi:uncharacterized protein (DUF2252 family)